MRVTLADVRQCSFLNSCRPSEVKVRILVLRPTYMYMSHTEAEFQVQDKLIILDNQDLIVLQIRLCFRSMQTHIK